MTPDQAAELTAALSAQLDARRPRLRVFDAYYRGDHPLAFAGDRFRAAFGGLLDAFADSWCDLIVDAVEERLNVNGFRFGEDTTADADAWRLWQANHLDAESQLGHLESLIAGVSYALVWPADDPDDVPSITLEHPEQVIVRREAGSRRRRAAALKRWVDDDGRVCATLYTPDALWKYRTRTGLDSKVTTDATVLMVGAGSSVWERREVDGEPWPLPNPLGVVPVVPLVNRGRLLELDGRSELASVIPVQDAVNKLVADMLVASEFGAFRQRWATGLDIPVDPTTGNAVEPFAVAVDRLWATENPETKFGQFDATDLGGYVRAIELLVQHVASQTRTPPHYFYLGGGQPPSGESIKSAETGLVAKVLRKQRHYGEAWEEVLRLAFLAAGDERRARVTDAETLWADPESRTEGEHIDAVLKRKALGVPTRQLWEDAGYSPAQVARFDAMRAEESALLSGLDSVFTAPAPGAPPAPPAV